MDHPNFTNFTVSETQEPDDMSYLEKVCNSPPSDAPDCNSFKWKVQVIDDDGNIEGKMVTSKDVWKFQNSRVIVHFDEESEQPVDDSGGLLGSWIGQLSNDVNLLPITYSDWRLVSPHIKEKAWDVIKSKFWFDDQKKRKKYVMSLLGSRCKDIKLRLWKEYKRDDKNEMIQNRPKKVPEDQWHHFVHMRFSDKWKKMQDRNTKSQKHHTTPHLCGRKSFARKRREITIKTGKKPNRAELFLTTRRKSDGSYVSDEAKTRAEALTTLLNQNSSVQATCNATSILNDEYAQVFGPERPGRVRCVGRGPTPSKLLRCSTAMSSEIENAEVAQLKMQNQALADQVKNMNIVFQKLFPVTSVDQAGAWATNFAAAFANIPNLPNSQEIGNCINGINTEDHGSDPSYNVSIN